MDNPVFHQWPGHGLTPAQMHGELNRRHSECTLDGCDMKRYCWTRLIDLGHPHPALTVDNCPACRVNVA